MGAGTPCTGLVGHGMIVAQGVGVGGHTGGSTVGWLVAGGVGQAAGTCVGHHVGATVGQWWAGSVNVTDAVGVGGTLG